LACALWPGWRYETLAADALRVAGSRGGPRRVLRDTPWRWPRRERWVAPVCLPLHALLALPPKLMRGWSVLWVWGAYERRDKN
jgi:hypothetical protein